MATQQVLQTFRKHGANIAEGTPRMGKLAEIMAQRLEPMSGPKFERSKRILRLIEQLHAELNAELADLAEEDRREPNAYEHNANERAGIYRYVDETNALAEYHFVQRARWLQAEPQVRQRLLVVSEVEHILKEARVNNYTDALRDRIALELLQASFEPALSAVTLKQTIVRFRR